MFEKITIHAQTPMRAAASEGNFYETEVSSINERIHKLRQLSVETEPSLSIERALHETAFYQENFGKMSDPVLRAANILDHCKKKAISIGEG